MASKGHPPPSHNMFGNNTLRYVTTAAWTHWIEPEQRSSIPRLRHHQAGIVTQSARLRNRTADFCDTSLDENRRSCLFCLKHGLFKNPICVSLSGMVPVNEMQEQIPRLTERIRHLAALPEKQGLIKDKYDVYPPRVDQKAGDWQRGRSYFGSAHQ